MVTEPVDETTIVTGKVSTSILKLPSKSVIVPMEVPFIRTFAPDSASLVPVWFTVPLIVSCEKAKRGKKNSKNRIKFEKCCFVS